jgi:hypothetical protein
MAICILLSILIPPRAAAQDSPPNLVISGHLTIDGREVPYRIRHLPVSSFPDLPEPVATTLSALGCLIPQTYEAHRPENVIHGSFEHPGSDDWAILCSVKGNVTLLVFFASNFAAQPVVLAGQAETDRLQTHDISGVLGFNWGIDPATPQRVHEAQAAMTHRPPPPDHDSIADSIVDQRTVYHLHLPDGTWEKLKLQ